MTHHDLLARERAGRVAAVDCHAHVLRTDFPLAEGARFAPTRDAPVQEYLQLLDEYGVSYGVITAPSFYGTDNRVLLSALAQAKGRLRGTVAVAPDAAPTLLQELAQQCVVGIRINTFAAEEVPDLASPVYDALLAMVHDLGWHVEFNFAPEHVADALQLMLRRPNRIVLDHFGAPDPASGIEGTAFRAVREALGTGRVWVKISTPLRAGFVHARDAKPYVDALIRSGGAEHVVWSTDWPWVNHETRIANYGQCLDWLGTWVEDDGARTMILTETPKALFGF